MRQPDLEHRDRDALPTTEQLHLTLDEQAPLVLGTALSDVVLVRVRRTLSSTVDLVELSDDEPVREAAARTITWLVEAIGGYLRLPPTFAHGHAATGRHAPLLQLVDRLDLLGLTIDRVYDAACRHDHDEVQAQLAVLRERFVARTELDAFVPRTPITAAHLDRKAVRTRGLEIGSDGIPRVPVPALPRHDRHAPPIGCAATAQEIK